MSDDKRVPSLRFKGFTDPWERYEFGEIFEERNDRGIDGLPILSVSIHHGISDHALDTAQLGKQVRRSEDKSLYKQVQQGDVVLNMMRAWQGAIGASATRGMVSPAYIVAKPILSSSYSFLDRYLKKPSIIKQINDLSYGVTDFRKRIYWNSFIRVQCAIPCRHEQSRIGALFAKLDSLIAFHQRKHDKLVVLKKSMLEKMFPKPGCKVPEIRFSGFTDPWEQRKLGELYARAGSGGTPSATNPNYYVDGSIPFLGISDICDRYIEGTAKHITEEGLKNSAAWIVPAGAIALAMYASVGKVGIIRYDVATSQAFYNMVFRSGSTRNFVYARLDKAELDNEWEKYISTGTQRNLNAGKVKNWFILIPDKAEQTLIGTFFQQLDDLITLHQGKLDVLKKVKKSLLEKMFI